MEWERYAESAWGVLSEEERRVACLRAISRAWRVLKSTMERCLKAPYLGSFLSASWKPTVFAETSEALILDFAFACRGFPLSEVQVRNMATPFANENGLHAFSQKKNNHTDYNWFKGFLKRHPELCVKRAEGLSAARSSARNKPSVEKWFVEYHAIHTKV